MSLETDKMNLRITIKALSRNHSRLACKMASTVGITGDFFHDQIDFEDPRINPYELKQYWVVSKKLDDATEKLDKLEHIDEPERHVARKKCFDVISKLPLEDGISLMHGLGCLNTTELIERLIVNPHLLDGVEV